MVYSFKLWFIFALFAGNSISGYYEERKDPKVRDVKQIYNRFSSSNKPITNLDKLRFLPINGVYIKMTSYCSNILHAALIWGLLCGLHSLCADELAVRHNLQPNIVLIVSDDGGWADFGFNGCPDFKTPNLDRLAAQGTIFKNGYVTGSVCSPSRAGLLVGKYQTRFGHEFNLPMDRQDTTGIPLSEKTLADHLKKAGYDTAIFGKWHLGSGKGYWPSDRGFDHSYAFLRGSRNYMPEKKKTDNDRTMRLNDVPQLMTEYLTDAIAGKTVDYIRLKEKSAKPLFLYVAFNCPHSPLQAKPGYEERFPALKGARKTIAAMQTSMDEGVGAIVNELKATGRWDNTIFWFINDNGGATYGNFNNGGLRNHKGSLFEGGVKVAWFVHLPRKVKSPRICEFPVISLDIVKTSLVSAGVTEDKIADLEGKNLLPYLSGIEKSAPERPLFWRQKNIGAVQSDGWKLILLSGQPVQLFNLAKDPFEKNNLVAEHDDRIKELATLYDDWNKNNIPPLWRRNEPDRSEWIYSKDAPWNGKRRSAD